MSGRFAPEAVNRACILLRGYTTGPYRIMVGTPQRPSKRILVRPVIDFKDAVEIDADALKFQPGKLHDDDSRRAKALKRFVFGSKGVTNSLKLLRSLQRAALCLTLWQHE